MGDEPPQRRLRLIGSAPNPTAWQRSRGGGHSEVTPLRLPTLAPADATTGRAIGARHGPASGPPRIRRHGHSRRAAAAQGPLPTARVRACKAACTRSADYRGRGPVRRCLPRHRFAGPQRGPPCQALRRGHGQRGHRKRSVIRSTRRHETSPPAGRVRWPSWSRNTRSTFSKTRITSCSFRFLAKSCAGGAATSSSPPPKTQKRRSSSATT